MAGSLILLPLIVFLASDEGGYLTGQSFMVDGGIHMHS